MQQTECVSLLLLDIDNCDIIICDIHLFIFSYISSSNINKYLRLYNIHHLFAVFIEIIS